MPTISDNLTTVNYTPRGTSPTWIVVHNTSNGTSAPPIAYNNTQYFKSEYRGASASYFVDDGDTVYRCVRDTDTAWHCGEAASRNGCYNSNSIGIEVCERADGTFSEKEISTLAWLVQSLMAKYGIDAAHVCRHHDVTGKECPWYYSDDSKWAELKARITEDDEMTDEQIKKLAKEIATQWGQAMSSADSKAEWGAAGKGKGKLYRNNYNTLRFVHELLIAIDAKLDKLVKKLGA